VPLHIPPLREHPDDITELLNYYVDHFAVHEKLRYRNFGVGAQNYLRNYPWPGNVRELKNMVQRLLILGVGDEISQEEVERTIGGGRLALESSEGFPFSFNQPLREARDQFERAYFEYHLDQHDSNVGKVAKVAEVERTNLYRKLKVLGIEIKQRK
jgi:DNA-binding NtrC family response regulator